MRHNPASHTPLILIIISDFFLMTITLLETFLKAGVYQDQKVNKQAKKPIHVLLLGLGTASLKMSKQLSPVLMYWQKYYCHLFGNKSESIDTNSQVTKTPFFLMLIKFFGHWDSLQRQIPHFYESSSTFIWKMKTLGSTLQFTPPQLLNFSFQAIKKKDRWNVV